MRSKTQLKPDEIIASLVETRKELLAAASTLPAKDRDEIFLGVWSVKDLLAHLIGWDFTNLQAAQEILTTQLPTFFAYEDHDWKTYNARLVAQYKKNDFDELLSAIEGSHQQLIDFLRTIPAEEMDRDRGLRSGRYKVTIARLLQFEIKDEQQHCQQLQEFGQKRSAQKAG
jgi:uncharacterized damage-inducible protein DinB